MLNGNFAACEICSFRRARFGLTMSQIYKSLGGSELNKVVIPHSETFAPILATLESQASRLDELGAHIAAAYLDAAIHRLRFEDIRLHQVAEA